MSLIHSIVQDDLIKLIFPGEPKPKQSTRFTTKPFEDKNGKLHYAYQDPKVKAMEKSIAWIAYQQLPKDFKIWDCPIMLASAIYVFPIPSGLSKTQLDQIRNGNIVYKTTKPDLNDNLNKAYFDALQGILFTNDSRICHIQNSMKIYGENPRAELTFKKINL